MYNLIKLNIQEYTIEWNYRLTSFTDIGAVQQPIWKIAKNIMRGFEGTFKP
jgi:hypothetical protein